MATPRSDQAPPVLDITPLIADRGDRAPVIDALADACATWGAFQITGHGVSPALVARFLDQMRRLFALPTPVKRAILRTADNPLGFYDRELTKNRPDWKQVFDCACERVGSGPDAPRGAMRPGDRNQWPAGLPAFKETVLDYIAACERVAFHLLRAVCQSLGLPPGALDRYFVDTHTSFLRLNYYPPCDEPAAPDAPTVPERGHLGVHHHTDAGALTIVLQDEVDGLQVHRDGRWHLIERVPGALIVNLADMLQVWTNDRYRSPVHRVLAHSRRPRYSAPYFFNPSYRTDCRPLTALRGARDARYRPINWGEFRRLRTDGDYTDHGEEVQIAHYRLTE